MISLTEVTEIRLYALANVSGKILRVGKLGIELTTQTSSF
jgi:hypothetical protein